MKRANPSLLLINEEVPDFSTLPDELKQLIIVSVHHRVSHLNTVCKEWHSLIERYTGWLGLVQYNFAPILEYASPYSWPFIDKTREILSILKESECPRRKRFINYVAFLLNCNLRPREPILWTEDCPVIDSIRAYVKEHTPNVLTLKNFHPRDVYLNFTEVGHRYTVVLPDKKNKAVVYRSVKEEDDNEKPVFALDPQKVYRFLSVTTFIHTLFPHFDAHAVIAKMMANTKKWNDPVENAYYGMTEEEIVTQWDEIRDLASKEGTAMHLNLEYFYSERPYVSDTKEFELFTAYEKDHVNGKLRPYRTEWTVWCELLQLCGSVDILYEYVNEVDHGDGKKHLVMRDWKRSKSISMYNSYQSGKEPCTMNMGDCNYILYTIQLCLYKYILETYYNVIIDSMDLVVLHPNQERYLCLPVKHDLFKPTLDKILQFRRETVAACA